MNDPLVTVGIPTYNRPDLLRKAIKSVINQTYHNLEIIVSDNCSDNYNFDEIKAEFNFDKRIIFFRMSKTVKAIDNFKFLKKKASGKYFMWLADDDWLDENYINECVVFILENDGYIFVAGRSKFFNEEGDFEFFGETFDSLDSSDKVDRIISYYSKVTYNSIFYSLIDIRYINVFENKNRLADDWILIQDLLVFGKGKQLDTIHVNRKNNGASKNFHSLKKALGLKNLTIENYPEFIFNVVKKSLSRRKIKKEFSSQEFIDINKKIKEVIFNKW